jgi:hypothetical protein
MDNKIFKERAERLIEIAKVLEKLPQEIRQESFQLLKGYVTGQKSELPQGQSDQKGKPSSANDGSKESFFASFTNDKPADNVKLIAAWFYREYGTDPFSLDELRKEADAVGITIPARPDATLKAARDKGKKLFGSAGKGKFKPTIHGEARLKESYSVKKGTKSRPQGDE